jgi:regulator of protease activity HflC (stomatin/prohibitin superfamily)
MTFAPSTRMQAVPTSGPGTVLFVIFMLAGIGSSVALRNPIPAFGGALLGFYCLFSVKVINQWEKVALLRLGKYRGLRGPGMIWIIPVMDTLSA